MREHRPRRWRKETRRNATKRLRSVRRYTRLTPQLVVSRDDSCDPSLCGRPPSSGGDSNQGPRERLGSDTFMRTGTRLCRKGLWLKLKMYSDNKLVKEEDEKVDERPLSTFGIGHNSHSHLPLQPCHVAPFQKILLSTEESRAESSSSAFRFNVRFFGRSSEGASLCRRLS